MVSFSYENNCKAFSPFRQAIDTVFTYNSEISDMHKNIKTLTWFNFFTDFSLYAPIAIIYFAKVSGSYTLGMSIFSIVMISSALFEVPTGIFSDYIGRRKTVIFGALSAVLFTIFYAMAQSYWILVIGALFEGLARSFYSGNNNALLHATLAETNDEHQYEEYLGRTSSMFQIAAAIAAIAGSLLASWSFTLIMWLSVIPQLICLFLSFKIIEPKVKIQESGNVYAHLKEAFWYFIHNKKLRLLSISSMVTHALGESTYNFRAAFIATLWPLWAIGFARSLSSIGASLSFHFSGRIIKKYGHFKILLVGCTANRVINILATTFVTVFSPLFMALTSLFFGLMVVAENSLMQKEFADKQRATMESLNSFGGNMLLGIVSILIGFIADLLSPSTAILLAQIAMIPVIYIYWKLFSNEKSSL